MKKQLEETAEKLDKSARDNNILVLDNQVLVNKIRNRKSRRKRSDEDTDSDSEIEESSRKNKKETPKLRKAKNQLELEYIHLEEKMAELDNRLVKTYEGVKRLDEDTLTSQIHTVQDDGLVVYLRAEEDSPLLYGQGSLKLLQVIMNKAFRYELSLIPQTLIPFENVLFGWVFAVPCVTYLVEPIQFK